jgi:hypothetical protein
MLQRTNVRLTVLTAHVVTKRFKCPIVVFILICLGGTACDDIFVKNISDKTVNIVSPVNHATLSQTKTTLVWETMEGAENYQIVIVSPSFDHIETYVCDSVTPNYKLKLPLSEGTYEWSVRASNSAYYSLNSYGTFQIKKP